MAEAVKAVSPKGVAVFPWLTRADTKFDADGVYRVTLRVPAEEAQAFIEKIDAVQQDIIAEESSKLPKGKKLKVANLPYKDALDDEGNETGEVDFTFKSKAKFKTKAGDIIDRVLTIVDAKKKPLGKNVPVYGGSVIKVATTIDPYYNPSVGAGVTMRISAVQVLELVSGSGGGDFGFEEEEGYEASNSAEANDAEEEEDF